MRIEIRAHSVPVTDDLRKHVTRRFRVIDRQVSALAQLTLELFERPGAPAGESQVAEATLELKGVTLRARSSARDPRTAIVALSEQLGVQVKRHRDKRRRRREARTADVAANAAFTHSELAANAALGQSEVPLIGAR